MFRAFNWKTTVAGLIAAGALGFSSRSAPAQSRFAHPEVDFKGALYRAVFVPGPGVLSSGDIAQVGEPLRGRLSRFLTRRSDFTSHYDDAPADVSSVVRDAKRRALERAIVSLIESSGIEDQAVAFVKAAPIDDEWARKPEGPLAESAFAEQMLQKEPSTPLAPFLYLFIAQRQRAAAEAAALNKNEDVSRTALAKAREFLLRARATQDPIFGLVADDLGSHAVRLRPDRPGTRMRPLAISVLLLALGSTAGAQRQAPGPTASDWASVEQEAVATLQRYVRIDTSNPPGDVRKAADFVEALLKGEGIPTTRYESAEGRSIVLARLKGSGTAKPILLMHHMDVVPTDPTRWTHAPFGAEIADGAIWGRGTLDMKGPGVAQLYAFIMLKRRSVPLDRDVLLMASPDEEIGGGMGAHLDAEYPFRRPGSRIHPRRGRLREPRPVRSRQARVRDLGRREEAALAEADGRRRGRPRLAAERSESERSSRPGARAPVVRAAPDLRRRGAQDVHGERRDARVEQVHQRDPALDDLRSRASAPAWAIRPR